MLTKPLDTKRLELWPIKALKEWANGAEPWPQEEARQLNATATRLFRCDWSHSRKIEERENCGGCMLSGYQPSRKADREPGADVLRYGPNYAGWLRVYVQAHNTPGIRRFRKALAKELATDNQLYLDALKKDIATFLR